MDLYNKLRGIPTVYYFNSDDKVPLKDHMERNFVNVKVDNFKRVSTSKYTKVNIVGVIGNEAGKYCGKKIIKSVKDSSQVDAIVMTNLINPDTRYKFLKKKYNKHNILLAKFINLGRK